MEHIQIVNGKFRDECLNQNVFLSLHDARRTVEAWRQDYNHRRPHSSLGWLTPEEFRAKNITCNPLETTNLGSVQNFSHILQQPVGEAWFRIEPRRLRF